MTISSTKFKIRTTFIFIICIILSSIAKGETMEHPFLIVKRSQFPELRKRAEESPWKEMEANARETVSAGYQYNPESANSHNSIQYSYDIGAVALLYILEPKNEKEYAQKIKKSILEDLNTLKFDESMKWIGVVPSASALWTTILCLDIVYDSLSPEEIKACESQIFSEMEKINAKGSWAQARMGLYGTWDIYTGKRIKPDEAYYKEFITQITPDGVNTRAVGYAFARLASSDSRPVKTGYADVLEFTGIDKRYYNNERLQKYYEWLFSLSITPDHRFVLIGDTGIDWGAPRRSLQYNRAINYSEKAGGYASWLMKGVQQKGHILSFIVPKKELPPAISPTSAFYADGGAWYRESRDHPDSMMAVLYNIKKNAGWHTHFEVNGLFLYALGERMLINGGWLGRSQGITPMQNTLAVNNQNHVSKMGNGLEEAFIDQGFAYACGLSGKALKNARFDRSMLFIEPTKTSGGYVIVNDDVKAQKGDTIQVYWHPATETKIASIKEKELYVAPIDHHNVNDDKELGIFFATKPASIRQDKVTSASLARSPLAGHHNQLKAEYPVEDNGQNAILTLLLPQKKGNPHGVVKRLSIPGYVGAEIRFSPKNYDRVFACQNTPPSQSNLDGLTFSGNLVYCQIRNNRLCSYFVRKGTRFFDENTQTGFKSEKQISLYQSNGKGQVISQGTSVTFYNPNLKEITVNGKRKRPAKEQTNEATVLLPKGTCTVEIIK